jgi:hypothetical protein
MRATQPRLLVIGGKYDLSFDLSEPQAYRIAATCRVLNCMYSGRVCPPMPAVDGRPELALTLTTAAERLLRTRYTLGAVKQVLAAQF